MSTNNGHQRTFCQKQILWKMNIFSGGHRSIYEWHCVYDEVDLGFTWDVIKYLHWETKWLTNSMIDEYFLQF